MNHNTGKSKQINIEAKSLDLAILQAANALNTTSDNIEYNVNSQTQAKFFGLLGSAKTSITAWIKSEQKSSNSRNQNRRATNRPDHRSHNAQYKNSSRNSTNHNPQMSNDRRNDSENAALDSTPLSPEETKTLIQELKQFCSELCQFIVDGPIDVDAWQEEDRLVINIKNTAMAEQLNRNIKLAESLEHILRKKPRHLKRELPFKIFIDADGLRKDREQELKDMAKDLSEQVHQNRKAVVLNYKSAYDRKIIHMALDQDERVFTKSIGSGPNRKLMILPAKDSPTNSSTHEHSNQNT